MTKKILKTCTEIKQNCVKYYDNISEPNNPHNA